MNLSGGDGVFIPDMPVLAANQVTIREGLRLANAAMTLAGHGRLFF